MYVTLLKITHNSFAGLKLITENGSHLRGYHGIMRSTCVYHAEAICLTSINLALLADTYKSHSWLFSNHSFKFF